MSIKIIEFQCASNRGTEQADGVSADVGKNNRVKNAAVIPAEQNGGFQTRQYSVKVLHNGKEARITDRISLTIRSKLTVGITEEFICKLNSGADDIRIVIDTDLAVNGMRKDDSRYTYDKAGNVETVTENGEPYARYVYDGLNRLIREDNVQFGTNVYRYDAFGNILGKYVYSYTLNRKLGLPQYVTEFAYAEHGRKDLLLSVNGEACEYDATGNPTLYRGQTMVWQGRRLKSYFASGGIVEYTYDTNGLRTCKLLNGVTYNYVYDGDTLIAEQHTDGSVSEYIYYLYGADGAAGFRYKGEIYLYRKNLHGDVTHIYKKEENGTLTLVAQYLYDAWGNHDVLDADDEIDDNVNSIGNVNPFRYRSYYYDAETGFYYLHSRYYDPETCRFISANGTEHDFQTSGESNVYAYGGNNPISFNLSALEHAICRFSSKPTAALTTAKTL